MGDMGGYGRAAVAGIMAALVFAAGGYSQGMTEISSFEDLAKIGVDPDYPLNGSYELTADINASASRELGDGAGFLPIGRRVVTHMDGFAEVLDTTKAFTGRFDGKGFAVRGLYINRTASVEANTGLFGYAHYAEIANLSVEADTVTGFRAVGALVGRMLMTKVAGCYSSGRVAGNNEVGGLVGVIDPRTVGAADTAVQFSYSSADVRGHSDVGGLVGVNEGSRIAGCYTTGTVTGAAAGQRVGGFVGYNRYTSANISRSFSLAAVSGGEAVGGFVGENGGMGDALGGTVTVSYSAGPVSGGGAGGFAGRNNSGGSVSSCYWDTERSGQAASDGGNTVYGRTSAQMRDSIYTTWGNLVSDQIWGWANNYPYIKKGIPVYTMTFRAGPGGKLSGRTALDSTLHTQRVNPGVDGAGVTARLSDIGESFAGWYLAGSNEKLAVKSYEGFTVAAISEDGMTIALSGLSADVDIEARFTLKKYTLSYASALTSGKVGGRVGIVGDGDTSLIQAADTLRRPVEYGSVGPVVVAVPGDGFKFVRWSDQPRGTVGEALRSDTAWHDTLFYAIFVSDSVTLTYSVEGTAGGILEVRRANGTWQQVLSPDTAMRLPIGGSGPVVRATVRAAMFYDWQFVGWTDGADTTYRADSFLQEDMSVAAVFEFISYKVTYTGGTGGKVVEGEWTPPEVDDGGDDNGDGGDDDTGLPALAPENDGGAAVPVGMLAYKVDYNKRGPLVTAVPDSGYVFVRWSDGVMTPARSDSLAKNADSMVVALFEGIVAVKSAGRVIPDNVRDETALIAPVMIKAGTFTAGPNPVSKHSGSVKIFWTGRMLKNGTLSVYDAGGALVGKVSVSDNSTGSGGRRSVGAWGLTDGKGRPAAEGAYLIRGTLTRVDGAKERVSLIIGVR
ncbi:MAG: hypothetical protein FWB85_03155 [Chitinispirillia bacterium]|nr:hypothetical protein [Chitinispirillia bacterium]MCL2241411.1 hypothetical protein [Chitinispirillia bacterium]